MELGSALKRAGFTRAEMGEALALHPDTADWTAEKGEAAHERQLDRIWDKVPDPAVAADPAAPWPEPATDLATADPLPPPALPLREVFPDGWAKWIESAAEAKSAPPGY